MASRRFPLLRLATLLARQLSKPVANNIKRFAVAHPVFRSWVCEVAARALRLRLWMLALRQPRSLPPLSERAALDSGANILGEIAVFGLGGLIIIFEVNRQADKQDHKELEEESRRLALLLSLAELQRELALQQQDIDRLLDTLRRLAPHHHRGALRPSASSSPPSVSPILPSSAPPAPPTAAPSTPPTSDRTPTASPSEQPTIPSLECPPPPTLECPPPPISECH